MSRFGHCMQPLAAHTPRREAAPLCRDGREVYREATEAELEAGYKTAFPDGPKPIATFRTDDPASMERARSVLSPEALNRFFGPGGTGMAGFMEAVEKSGAAA